ncbi:hypothetical protein [Actinomadura rugatobispora]|uniref:WD40 repeat domain-containing protein n=1 Tax=Actinomadura rugatobispora TaxID=1994 RepID=A0ABW1A4Z2_9ACTN|nr:hypothetical protein GCM10010200_074310 [Actinomadura rugatobispora]
MDVLPCGHVAYASTSRMCRHLLGPDGDEVDHVRLLTGRGLEYDMACEDCDQAGGDPELIQVCEGCAERVADEDNRSMVGWRGEPEILERPEPVDPALTVTPLPRALRDPLDWAAIAGESGPVWLFLTERRRLVRFDAASGEHEALTRVPLRREKGEDRQPDRRPRLRLHVSPSGRFAAVVHDRGTGGTLVDLRSGQVMMTLNGGDHRTEHVPFSLAFAEHQGREVVVHRTDWNRLDVSDPATGALLTRREHPEAKEGERFPEHHLDYFHGALHVSPDGRWIADDGWVWAPVGVPAVWDLRRWLDGNPWESEDGPSRQRLCWRDYSWNEPMCWVSDTLVALSGIGRDDLYLLDGVQIFDAGTGAEVTRFAGPRRPLLADDRRLYSAGADGLEIWDPFTGERTGAVPGFVPERHHPGAAELAALRDDALVRWRTRP